MIDFRKEMALEENRAAMTSFAWRYCFDDWIQGDQRRVIRIWNSVRSHCDRTSSDRMIAAMAIEFKVSGPVARDLLKRTVDLGLLSENQDQAKGTIKNYTMEEEIREKLAEVFQLGVVIEQVISLQREAGEGVYDAGKELLPNVPHKHARKCKPEQVFSNLYIDTRDPSEGKNFNLNVMKKVKEMHDAKKGKTNVKKMIMVAAAGLFLAGAAIAEAQTVQRALMADTGELYLPPGSGGRQQS